jgi:hypothetical protein
LAPTTPFNVFLSREKQDAQESNDENVNGAPTQQEQFLKDVQRFREDVILDFAAFESSIARIQFLRAANERERERYVAERQKIEATAADVRENTASLRVQLDEAQRTLAVRKTYDVLADKITKNPALKPRDEQHGNVERLKAEIEELEREAQEHTQAWAERREQVRRVLAEGLRLRRVLRDEKEPEAGAEAEAEAADDGDDGTMLGVDHHGRDRDGLSNAGTPRPTLDDAPTPSAGLRGSGAATPRSAATLQAPADGDVDMDSGAVEEDLAAGKPSDTMDTT